MRAASVTAPLPASGREFGGTTGAAGAAGGRMTADIAPAPGRVISEVGDRSAPASAFAELGHPRERGADALAHHERAALDMRPHK